MKNDLRLAFLSLCLALVASSARAQPAAGLTRIGAAAIVRGHVEARMPGADSVGRVMGSGQPVYLNDAITTDAQGRMQIILLDETVFTIGPNSNLVLDKFVYDPKTGAGEVSANIAKGVFRFITGKIARKKPSNMKVTLPVGTIGVFGTEVAGMTDGTEATVVLLGPGGGNNTGDPVGGLSVTAGGRSVYVGRPGYGTTIGGPDQAPVRAYEIPAGILDDLSRNLNPPVALEAQNQQSPAAMAPSGASAGTLSGQDIAAGGTLLSNIQQISGTMADLAEVTNAAAAAPKDNFIPNGTSTWDQVRTVAGTLSGATQATFEGTAPFTHDGLTPCGGVPANCTGTWSVNFDIDFAQKTFSGVGTIATPNIGGAAAATPAGIFYYADPAEFSGPATMAIPSGDGNGLYSFTVSNADNTPAKTMTATVVYNDGANSGVGAPISGSR